ncbi:MAG: VanZ family protein [Streptococcus minor]|nr:VanZ family protein [Streptococcus minor]
MLSSKKTTQYLFYAYLILLTWGILFKFETRIGYIYFFQNTRFVNWVPFSAPLIANGNIVWEEMFFNLFFFIPMGVCLPLLKSQWSVWQIIYFGFLLSLLYEGLQFILAVGMTDITDLMLNTLGAGIGLLLYQLFLKLFKSHTRKWVNVIGLIIVTIPLSVLVLFVIIGF